MDIQKIKLAIEDAEQERDGLLENLKEFQILQQRINNLNKFISEGNNLLGITTEHIFTEDKIPIWKRIKEILKEYKKSMTPSEITSIFHERKWSLSEMNGVEVIRTAMLKKPKIFHRLDNKMFKLLE